MIGIPSSDKKPRKKHVGTCGECGEPTIIEGSNYLTIGSDDSARRVLHCPKCAAPILLQRIEAERQELLRKLA